MLSTTDARCLGPRVPFLLGLLAGGTRAFLPAPAGVNMFLRPAPHDVSSRRPGKAPRGGGRPATVEDSVGTAVVTAEVWDGFGEDDHERFLGEFWQKKPLLIRRAVPG